MSRPPPSTVRRFRRRPEYVEAVQSTLPVSARVEGQPLEPGEWLIIRHGQPSEVMGDESFRALYVEDEEHAEQHPAAVPGTPIWEVRL